MPAELDSIDLRILRLLQRDGGLGIAQISASVGLSHTPCWRRIKRLEENGVIRDRVAMLDPQEGRARRQRIRTGDDDITQEERACEL